MRTHTRVPNWKVTIRRPDYSRRTLSFITVPDWTSKGLGVDNVNFVSDPGLENGVNNYTDLKAYEYNNSLGSPSGEFSLEFTARMDRRDRNWKDKIHKRDLIYIYEFGKLEYIGIVKNTSYSSSMNGAKTVRTIDVTGNSIGGMLETFDLPMNLYLWYDKGVDATTVNQKFLNALNANLEEGKQIGNLLQLIQDNFFEVNFGSGLGSSGFSSIINTYYELEADSLASNYPLNLQPFQTDSNTLWTLFRQILPLPVYEIFGRYEKNKYKLICREAPFDLTNWNNLKATVIDPLSLVSQKLSDTDEEVYTHYYSQMPQSGYTEQETYANQSLSEVSVFDTEKFPIYGYKQLQSSFPFFDIETGKDFDAKEYLKKNSQRMYAWYKNNLDFQSGQITVMTSQDKDKNQPKVGEKLRYLRGDSNKIEFYIEGITRTMRYPEAMQSVYSVTRGYEYSSNGDTITIDGNSIRTPQVGKIRKLGLKLKKAEEGDILND